jgi:hypothetical protein
VQREGLGPKDHVAAAKQALEQTAGDLMIVGYLPFLSKLVALLVTGSEENEIVEFRFGSVVCLERIDTLNFCWGITAAAWDKNYAALVVYKEAHGHCNVPKESGSLGRWCHSQRHRRSQSTPERIAQLDALGFRWVPKHSRFGEPGPRGLNARTKSQQVRSSG